MRVAISTTALAILVTTLLFTLPSLAQQQAQPAPGNAGHASLPGSGNLTLSAQPGAGATQSVPGGNQAVSSSTKPQTITTPDDGDDNPYDPLLEPPPLPKGKPTLIGGIATRVDHVRNRMTVQPFGGGPKVKIFIDERSHIYRNGTETTVLGIQKGDRVYVDTMLDGSHVFAKNVRVMTQPTLAEVRGQVIAVHPDKGTISVQDQLSAHPVTFAIGGSTRYSSSKGSASAGDVQPGSLIDVQFAAGRDNRDVAQQITVLAKPGDNYIFSGVVTGVDMHSNLLVVENRSDDQDYEVHFTNAALSNPRALKVGSEITARATFDGKQYKASNVRIESSSPEEGEQSKVE